MFNRGFNLRKQSMILTLTGSVFLLAGIGTACKAAERGADLVNEINAESGIPFLPLDEETLNLLELSIGESSQAQPGDQLEIEIGITKCCYIFEPVDAEVAWSVFPEDGAEINPRSGKLEIGDEVETGEVFTITAEVEGDRKQLIGRITVFRPEDDPLVGTWHESEVIPCAGGEAPTDGDPLREMIFNADGTFKATFTPFEIYHDYWGTYQFDQNQKKLALQVVDGNYVPEDLDLEGEYTIDQEGNLNLKDIWLGRKGSSQPRGCGHRFVQ